MVGNRTRIKIVKNKIAPPFKEAEFDIMFGKGISRAGDILDLAAGIDLVKKSGAWYAYEGEKIGQGRENAKAYWKIILKLWKNWIESACALSPVGAGEDAETAGDKTDQKSGDKKNDVKKNGAESDLSLAGGKKG